MTQDNQPQMPSLPGGPAGPLALLVSLALMPLQLLQSILQGFSTTMAAGPLSLPPPFATSRSNDEVEEIERDDRGFIIRRTVKRVVR